MTDDLPQILNGGEPARLFPVLAETSKEGRALSVLLACFASIDDLASTLLSTLDRRVGVRSACGHLPRSCWPTSRRAFPVARTVSSSSKLGADPGVLLWRPRSDAPVSTPIRSRRT